MTDPTITRRKIAMNKHTRIPSLAEIANDPSLITTLDRDVAAALSTAMSGLAASLAFRAVVDPPDHSKGGRALSIKEAAQLLGVTHFSEDRLVEYLKLARRKRGKPGR
jgi:hypothetical protein